MEAYYGYNSMNLHKQNTENEQMKRTMISKLISVKNNPTLHF